MEIDAIVALIENHMPDAFVQVKGDGSHFEAVIVSSQFEGLPPVKRQRLVMEALREQIADGSLHAISFKALTPAQAEGII